MTLRIMGPRIGRTVGVRNRAGSGTTMRLGIGDRKAEPKDRGIVARMPLRLERQQINPTYLEQGLERRRHLLTLPLEADLLICRRWTL